MGKINWTYEAKWWLKEIFDYIAKDNKKIAIKVIQDIYKQVNILNILPNCGYAFLGIENRNIRVIQYGHYRIVYLIKEENFIDILGVLHGSLDMKKYINHWI